MNYQSEGRRHVYNFVKPFFQQNCDHVVDNVESSDIHVSIMMLSALKG